METTDNRQGKGIIHSDVMDTLFLSGVYAIKLNADVKPLYSMTLFASSCLKQPPLF